MSIAFANKYWLWWFIILLVSFLIPEIYSLATHHVQGTLSDTIWRLEGEGVGKPFKLQWNAFHFLFIGELVLVDVWLIFHFGWGWFR